MTKRKARIVPPPPPETPTSAYEAALKAVRDGLPLKPADLQAIVRLKRSAFHRHASRGDYDILKLRVPIGVCQYSPTLVGKWLAGEDVYENFFGKKHAKRWTTALKKAGGTHGPTGT